MERVMIKKEKKNLEFPAIRTFFSYIRQTHHFVFIVWPHGYKGRKPADKEEEGGVVNSVLVFTLVDLSKLSECRK